MKQTSAVRDNNLEFDYIVVGGGSAGCLLANRLSRDPATRVLLLEAGRKDDYPWIHIPVGYLYCIGNPRTDWLFKTEPDAGLNGRSLRYPRGKTLGGCSSINGMIYMRGQARDFDGWAAATGDDAWSWENSLPDFKAHEDHYRLDGGADYQTGGNSRFSDMHGHGGEWRVEKQRLKWDILESFAEAAVQAGIPRSDDFNSGDNEGVGYFEVNQRSGWRWNTSKAFLRPAKTRPNLSIWTQSHVERLMLETDASGRTRCAGVVLSRRGDRVEVRAKKEVILSAGAIGSPHILQLSGIGPAHLLKRHGIEVVHDLPGVGENLQDHLQIRAVYKVGNAKTLNTIANSLIGKAMIGLEYALRRSGPMSMAPSQLGAFTRSDAAQAHANLEFHVQPLSLDAFGEPLHRIPAFTASVCNLNPTSVGTVRLRSGKASDAPAIAPNYLSTEDDRRIAADSIRQIRRIVTQSALAKYRPEEWKPGPQFQSDEELAKLAGDIANTIFHPVGTTKMGRDDDPTAVVDSRLRVRGIAGLRVVDAGIMPKITSGNTNAPTLMIAEKTARWIVEEARQLA
ncbi:putative glucose-methanol-choline oxidoreductase (plasmid) [Sinorhizobium fredii NGR234]|uniref:Alcohol dehydrogenase (Acceptor) n=1 Tax=Sinorhizobium fredii (strain NBRC 101917 / NGR234) TaxID=394 RepID=Q6W1G2_SINFN|nr:GMC family oxidoreductase N-terminal domain-containing protein [Sinorhizobium fredii]AAQ87406.1 Alcohol dehydrogenase (acceptor) [Sinorhizobium fredii NGR234]ACP21946.1 putative glucose-methanol-choline oxidoreductase [Sinorhizobium fredii NGR234]